jgi:hypothetical protein
MAGVVLSLVVFFARLLTRVVKSRSHLAQPKKVDFIGAQARGEGREKENQETWEGRERERA